jgi:SPP1 family predicted phage head-tail adaptor
VSETRIPPIGTLTDRVQLLRKVESAEPEGGTTIVYSPLVTVWARVRELSSRQAFADDARGQSITHSVVLRFRADIKPGDGVSYRGRTLEIEAAADINGRRAYLALQCRERAVTG